MTVALLGSTITEGTRSCSRITSSRGTQVLLEVLMALLSDDLSSGRTAGTANGRAALGAARGSLHELVATLHAAVRQRVQHGRGSARIGTLTGYAGHLHV